MPIGWGAGAEQVAAFLLRHVPSDRIHVVALYGPPRSLEDVRENRRILQRQGSQARLQMLFTVGLMIFLLVMGLRYASSGVFILILAYLVVAALGTVMFIREEHRKTHRRLNELEESEYLTLAGLQPAKTELPCQASPSGLPDRH